MPGTLLKGNNPSADILMIGGQMIDGWGSDGGVTYETVETATVTTGCDGETVVNVKRVNYRLATIKLKSTGYAYKRIQVIRQAQYESELATGVIPILSWFHFIAGRGTTVTASYVQFLDSPLDGTAAEAPEVEFKVHLQGMKESPGFLNFPG